MKCGECPFYEKDECPIRNGIDHDECGEPYDWPKNVWAGVTVEDKHAFSRVIALSLVKAPVRFISFEPLLEDVAGKINLKVMGVNWVIVGGETGPGARPMDPDWARGIRDQAAAAGVPFFFKKMGGNRPTPPDLAIREFPTF